MQFDRAICLSVWINMKSIFCLMWNYDQVITIMWNRKLFLFSGSVHIFYCSVPPAAGAHFTNWWRIKTFVGTFISEQYLLFIIGFSRRSSRRMMNNTKKWLVDLELCYVQLGIFCLRSCFYCFSKCSFARFLLEIKTFTDPCFLDYERNILYLHRCIL